MATLDKEPIDWVVNSFNSLFELISPLFNSWFAWFIVAVILGLVVSIFALVFKLVEAGSRY